MNFEEARRNPEKKMKIMSGRKVPFREQALPTIIYRIYGNRTWTDPKMLNDK